MIQITKEEAEQIRKRMPWAHIAIVNRQKKASQKTRFVEESPKVLNFLNNYRLRSQVKTK